MHSPEASPSDGATAPSDVVTSPSVPADARYVIREPEPKKFEAVPVVTAPDGSTSELGPLKLTCSMSDCAAELHCFVASKRRAKKFENGACKACGRTDLVAWERVRRADINDVEFVLAELEKEQIRHVYFHADFDQHARNNALRKGRRVVLDSVRADVIKAVGHAKHFAEGMQTKYTRDVRFYARHATASCCRKCVAHWHGFPEGVALNDAQIDYLTALATAYLVRFLPTQIPELTDEPRTGVPNIKKKAETP